MWEQRLDAVLSAPFELLTLKTDGDEAFRGRYLRFNESVFGLGTLIAHGGEALVFELINLEHSVLTGVAKICRFRPGSKEYRTWAVPFRFEGNELSAHAEIELYPARLLEVEGGFIKLQPYVAADPERDYATPWLAADVYRHLKTEDYDEALKEADALECLHGPRGAILEARGQVLVERECWEEARDVLERAMDAFRRESRAGLLRTGTLLAQVHKKLYQLNGRTGADATITLNIPGGPSLSQVVFSSNAAAGMDDTLDDRSLYVLFEVLGLEPYSIPNLVLLADEMAASQLSDHRLTDVVTAIERVDPDNEAATFFRQRAAEEEERRREFFASRSFAPDEGTDPDDDPVHPFPTPSGPPPPFPIQHLKALEEHERNYQPEPIKGQTAEARILSAYSNLRQGRVAEAELAARHAIALQPTNVGAHLALAKVFTATERGDEARATLEAAVEELPTSAEIYLALGDIFLNEESHAEARLTFLRALVMELDEPWRAHLGLGEVLRRLGERDEAIRYLRLAAAEAPREPGVVLQLANSLRMNGEQSGSYDDLAEALAAIDGALVHRPDVSELLVCRAQILCVTRDIGAAIAALERAVTIAPDHPIAARFLASLRQHEGGKDAGAPVA